MAQEVDQQKQSFDVRTNVERAWDVVNRMMEHDTVSDGSAKNVSQTTWQKASIGYDKARACGTWVWERSEVVAC